MSKQPAAERALFHFKKFSLSDQGCGMRIGTDGVLLGSLAAGYPGSRVLDIGTGCGLIALMVAQKNPGMITGLDIDPKAVARARQNAAMSPWADRIHIIESSFQDFLKPHQAGFDLVVCNPPFFHNSLKPTCAQRQMARHSSTLSLEELLEGVAWVMPGHGKFLVILPAGQAGLMEKRCGLQGLFINRRLWIIPIQGKPARRVIMELSKAEAVPREESLCIEENRRHEYSEAYRELTRDYYPFF